MSLAVTVSEPAHADRLVETYAAAVAARHGASPSPPDETFRADGTLRGPHVWEHLESLGPDGLEDRRREILRLTRDEGVGAHAPSRLTRWRLDPVPLVYDESEWARLEAGIIQRARLLDAVLTDLYGPRRLLHDGLLPAELVLGHDGYLLPAHGISLPGPRQLLVAGLDVARTRDGWVAVTERTQAPAGIGLALANRRLVTRVLEPVFRATRARRLRGFFEVLQRALQDAAPPGVTNPRVVLMSPGTGSDTAYDQSLVATMLGHPLVVADDLVVHDGAVWLRNAGRDLRVHVVNRRVDGDWSDPLDLRAGSRLGVPGLLAAARRGTVSVVNPIGSGVLENVGMAPYLPAVARAVLGEDLLIGAPTTWWCGDPGSRRYVLANLGSLVLRPTSRSERPTVVLGWELSASERDALSVRISARPWEWVGQEPIEASTAPAVTPSGLSPRAMVLRTFRISVDGEDVVMPGGYAKVAARAEDSVVRGSHGTITKDVWVLEPEQEGGGEVVRLRSGEHPAAAVLPALTPRAAADLYWLGRYSERAEATARLVSVAENLADDHLSRPGSAGHQAMEVILTALGQVTGVTRPPEAVAQDEALAQDEAATVTGQLRTVLLDTDRPGTVAYAVARASADVIAVRDLLSPETVAVTGTLADSLEERRTSADLLDAQGVASTVLQSCLALAGIAAESLVRDGIWRFTDAGRRLERAQTVVTLLRHTLTRSHSPVAEAVVVESVLRAADTSITYRRRMAAGVGPAVPAVAAVELLVRDETNPRSVAYQLDRLTQVLDGGLGEPVLATLSEARSHVALLDPDTAASGEREGLVEELDRLDALLRCLSATIERVYFARQRPSHAFAVQER